MQIYWNKRKRLHKKRVQLPQDWFGTPTWPPFHCFGTPIWPPWRHVKTFYRKMTRTPRSLVGILIELKGYCMMTSFYCNYHNPLVCCFLCKLASLFFKPRREIFDRLPFLRKFRWKISVKWYWYVFLAKNTGTELCCTIYKIPVNFFAFSRHEAWH